MEWADAHTWRVARSVPGGQTDERLRWLLHHIHLVQSVYLQAWRGDPFVVTELSSYRTCPRLKRGHGRSIQRPPRSPSHWTKPGSGECIEYPWTDLIVKQFGSVVPSTMSESAWQVVSHTTYHRGQVATRLRELGGEPPLVDFLVWVWGGRPAPEW